MTAVANNKNNDKNRSKSNNKSIQGLFIVLVCAAALVSPGRVVAKCTLAKLFDLPVTMSNLQPLVTAQINGVDASFLADSGAFYSIISPAAAAQYNLKLSLATGFVEGVGGDASVHSTVVKTFTLAGHPISNVGFLVGGGDVGSDSAGVLGQNVFRLSDVEYDLANGVIRLMQEKDCGNADLAYWAPAGSPVSAMAIEGTTPQSPHTSGFAFVNGVRVRVVFDTGAGTSYLSLKAAQRAGISVDGPGVTFSGYTRGFGRHEVKTWIVPVASFKVGDEEIRNTHLRVGESVMDGADMLIGADFFLSHRVYVAGGQRRLYFTYNGGAVFNLKPMAASPVDPQAAAAASPAVAAAEEPKDAADFARRGTALAARQEFGPAIAELTRACELAPNEPNYFYERALARWQNKEQTEAAADFDRALELKPDHVPALLARAEFQGPDGASRALADLDAADRFASKEADARLRMAIEYMHLNHPAQAKTQLDLWIAVHGVDARLGDALVRRCMVRGLLGTELNLAMDDCNRVIHAIGKTREAGNARIYQARGLVELRLGDYKKSVADYEAALELQPKFAFALYGKGVAETRLGKPAEGQADREAAVAIMPRVTEEFDSFGVRP